MSPTAQSPESPVRRTRLVLHALMFLLAGATLTALWSTPRWLSGYFSTSSLARWVGMSAGVGLIASGGIEAIRRPRSLIGPSLMILGNSWLAMELVGRPTDPQIVRIMGLVLAPLLVPALAYLGLSYPGSQPLEPLHRRFLVIAFVAALAAGVSRALFYDPFFDVDCWRTCIHISFVPFPSSGLAAAVEGAWRAAAVASCLLTVVLVTGRLVKMSRSARSRAWYMLIPITLASCGLLLAPPLVSVSPGEHPLAKPYRTGFLFVGACLIAVGLAATWGMTLTRAAKRRLRTLAADLEAAPAPGAFPDLLAASLGDDTLEVAYWMPELGGHIAPDGRVIEVSPRPDRAITSIERGGETLGLVTHHSTLETANLEREIGSAARLAIDNERLRSGLLAEMGQLRASQQKIVETGDSARRRIERDLHDGAQQRLLALSYDMRLALAAATDAGDPAAPTLAEASDDVRVALAELRELAHGIFPSILADAGLAAALEGLAETAPIPIEVQASTERFPVAVELSAYQAASECVLLAQRAGAVGLTVSAVRVADDLVLDVHVDSGRLSDDDLIRVSDRIGAAGGTFELGEDRVRAVIPCV